MNWTGGGLSRHSRRGATASLNQRQKAHFVKVQNNLRNDTKKQSPIKWSIFGKIQVQQADHERQSSVESPRSYIREASQLLAHGTPRYTKSNGLVSRDSHVSQLHEPQHSQQQEDVREDDLYSATPQPLEKRKHQVRVSGNGLYEEEEIDFVSKKRKRLLEKGDWVGISYQRPLQMKFASPNHTENVGRRRKITDGHRVQYANRQSTLASPFITRARPPSLQKFDTRDRRGRTDVRIHIGDRVVPPGISSSTAPSRRSRRHSAHRQIRGQPQVASSDVMLLDNEEVLASALSLIVNETAFGDQQSEAFDYDHYNRSQHSPGAHFEDAGGHDDDESGRDGQFDNGTNGRQFGDEENSVQIYHNPYSTEADRESSPYLAEGSVSPILGTPFSPTLIKHPIPQSARVSSILHSGSSEIANSTLAQVGKVKPLIPSSQILGNEIWETWMVPLHNEEQFNGQSNDEYNIEQGRSISPGISTAPARRIRRPAPKQNQENAIEVEVEEFDEVDKASWMANPSTGGSSANEDCIKRREPPQKTLRHQLENRRGMGIVEESKKGVQVLNKRSLTTANICTEQVEADAGSRMKHFDLPLSDLRDPNHSLHARSKASTKKGEDADHLWRKFVFGSDEAEEIDYDPALTLSMASEKQNVMASSLGRNLSTRISANPLAYTERQIQNTPARSNTGNQPQTPSPVSRPNTSSSEIPWDPPKGVASTTYLSTRDDYAGVHAFQRSPHPPDSDLL